MRVAFITAGAAGTICGNCLQDNALAMALQGRGHDIILIPAYTPVRTDERNVADKKVVYSGLSLYLQGRFPIFRRFSFLDRLLDNPKLLEWVSGFAVETDPSGLGPMTRDTLAGINGPYAREMRKMLEVLRAIEPEIVHLTNSMLASMAEPIRNEFGIPVVCSLQGEADFLHGLPEPYRDECFKLLRKYAGHVDRFVAPCADQADAMAGVFQGTEGEVAIIMPGLSAEDHPAMESSGAEAFRVGFLARVAPVKGLRTLAEAVELLRGRHPSNRIDLHVAGWRGADGERLIKELRTQFAFDDHGYLTREEKFAFLASLDAFSVPASYRASKGLYVLEAMATGVPVVQPRIGAYSELLEATDGGLTCEPASSEDLADKLESLLIDRKRAKELGERGRKAVRERFHTERMAGEALTLYRSLLN